MERVILKEHSQFERKYWILGTASSNSFWFIDIIMQTFIYTVAILNEE